MISLATLDMANRPGWNGEEDHDVTIVFGAAPSMNTPSMMSLRQLIFISLFNTTWSHFYSLLFLLGNSTQFASGPLLYWVFWVDKQSFNNRWKLAWTNRQFHTHITPKCFRDKLKRTVNNYSCSRCLTGNCMLKCTRSDYLKHRQMTLSWIPKG